jgi:riboflavin synthase
MFTGIIEGPGTMKAIQPVRQGKRLCIEAGFDLTDTAVGDSIAVCGACLTAVSITGKQFEADVAPETLSKTTISDMHPGDRVNLERALRFSDRLDGHLVTGHIDGTGWIESKQPAGNAIIIRIGLPPELSYYMVSKGSVAIDGISLTINNCDRDTIEVSIIPHTAEITTIGLWKTGDRVNIESDIIGKYVNHFLRAGTRGKNSGKDEMSPDTISREFLAKTGFL